MINNNHSTDTLIFKVSQRELTFSTLSINSLFSFENN